jgi:hypothetical protein
MFSDDHSTAPDCVGETLHLGMGVAVRHAALTHADQHSLTHLLARSHTHSPVLHQSPTLSIIHTQRLQVSNITIIFLAVCWMLGGMLFHWWRFGEAQGEVSELVETRNRTASEMLKTAKRRALENGAELQLAMLRDSHARMVGPSSDPQVQSDVQQVTQVAAQPAS